MRSCGVPLVVGICVEKCGNVFLHFSGISSYKLPQIARRALRVLRRAMANDLSIKTHVVRAEDSRHVETLHGRCTRSDDLGNETMA